MININILTNSDHPNFIHQVDKKRFGHKYSFFENSKQDIVWDLVVVYEGIRQKQLVKVKNKGMLFISGEPPMSSIYPKNFLKQFDYVISSHPKIKHSNNILTQQALNWHFGYDFNSQTYKYDYEKLSNIKRPIKLKNISIISSSKKMMPGHNKRMKLIDVLKNKFPEEIDYFGKNTNPINDKADALLPYRFHICIENSFINDYWTEKFADPILGYSIPIYIGCKNIKKYFKSDFFFNYKISETKKILDLIEDLVARPNVYYNARLNKLETARKKLLNNYNLFTILTSHHTKYCNSSEKFNEIQINPAYSYNSYSFLLKKLRLKRLFYKTYINILK